MNEYMKIIKQQEFRKQTEEAKFEAFSAMCEKVADLEKKNAELKRIVEMVAMIKKGIYSDEGIKAIYAEAEQFLKEK